MDSLVSRVYQGVGTTRWTQLYKCRWGVRWHWRDVPILRPTLCQLYSLGCAVLAAKKDFPNYRFLWQPCGCFKSNPKQNLCLCSPWYSQLLAKRPAEWLAGSRDDKLIPTCGPKRSWTIRQSHSAGAAAAWSNWRTKEAGKTNSFTLENQSLADWNRLWYLLKF